MSHTLHGENVAAFTQTRPLSSPGSWRDSWRSSWRVLFARLADTARAWHRRQRERRELLHYLETDHRAAMDLGIDLARAREWAYRPFWQA